ncbi:GAF domain-containing sensor histidine kinase [Candidatus Synechococcus calcipolaris]|uniref:sensor histidine kinase n=1 Tax=Candidatus Synechococcus calcipolaris TaxID=1522304 RepID=UPI0024113951|nr:GAF domain-containing sensor histidine kinase [Candidatus Synechococcus calcipolaris]
MASLSYRSGNLQDYLQAIAHGVSQLIASDWSVVTLCDDDHERVLASTLDLGDEEPIYILHGTITHRVVQLGQALWVEDVRHYPDFGEPPEGYLAYLGVPLCTPQGKILGTICSFNMQPRQYRNEEIQIVELFAERAATAIDNYALYQIQQEFNSRLEAEIKTRTTQLEAAQAQLLEQARLVAIGEFAAMIVHELRNPLTTIKMGLNYFCKLTLPPSSQERLTLALEESKRLEMLLSEILLYAKPQILNQEPFDMSALGLELTHILEDLPETEDKPILWKMPPQPVIITGDRDKLKQVFFNLIQNACEAGTPYQPITCQLQTDREGWIRVSIHNVGSPIPPEDIPKLTQPFYSRKPGGTGLGLAIVDRIIAAHRGQLTISSSEEEGTTVLVTLPWESTPVK